MLTKQHHQHKTFKEQEFAKFAPKRAETFLNITVIHTI